MRYLVGGFGHRDIEKVINILENERLITGILHESFQDDTTSDDGRDPVMEAWDGEEYLPTVRELCNYDKTPIITPNAPDHSNFHSEHAE